MLDQIVTMTEVLKMTRVLQSIEAALWWIFGAFLVANVLLYIRYREARLDKTRVDPDWNKIVESAYDKGEYQKALQTLATYELLFPGSALIRYWQGKCYFLRCTAARGATLSNHRVTNPR